MITAKQLKSGSWTCRVRVNGRDISVTKSTKKEAEKEARMVKSRLEAEEAQRADTVGEIVDRYITYVSGLAGTSPSTVRGYKSMRRNRFKTLMSFPVRDLTDKQFQNFIDAESVGPKTLKNGWALVHASILWSTGRDVTVRLPKQKKHEHAFLMPEEIQVLIRAAVGLPEEVPILLGLHSLRRSEILALRWSDIDVKSKKIFVHSAIVPDENNKPVYRDVNKTDAGTRCIPIFIPRLFEIACAHEGENEYVYPVNYNTIQKQVDRLCDANGLPKIGAHGLRHSFASLAYSLRIPEKVTMRWGGWADSKTMHDIYVHIGERDMDKYSDVVMNYYAESK